jgi:hypothetical protein
MGFSVLVEMINLRVRESHVKPVNLRDPYKEPVKAVVVKSAPKKVAKKDVRRKTK